MRGWFVDPRLSHSVGVLALGAAVALSWQTQCAPTAHKLRAARQRLTSLQQQVERIEQLIRGGGGESVWVARQQQRLEALRQRIPSSAQVPRLLDALLEQVSGAALHLTDVSQGNLEPAKDVEGSPVMLDGLPCLRLPISLTAEGRFQAVVALLERLVGAGFPGLVTIERARLAIKDPLNAQLNAAVQLALYVVEH